MFEGLGERVQGVFKDLRGEGHLTDYHLETALRQTGGNQTKASALLGLRVQTLNMKLKRFAEQNRVLKIER